MEFETAIFFVRNLVVAQYLNREIGIESIIDQRTSIRPRDGHILHCEGLGVAVIGKETVCADRNSWK